VLRIREGKDFKYEIKMRGEIPPPSVGAFSAIYDNQVFIFGGTIERNGQEHQDFGQIYSFHLGKESFFQLT